MSEVESVLSAEQRARGQALIIARDVLKATSFVSSSAVAAADLITVAEYVLHGGSFFIPEERDRVDETSDGEFEVRDGSNDPLGDDPAGAAGPEPLAPDSVEVGEAP